jgi:hydrogenase maturation protease
MSARILIACVGNIFLGDDAFGVEVAHRLSQQPLQDGVTVSDYGIRSYDLAYALMQPWDLVILVDAVSRGEVPGTVFAIEPDISALSEQGANTAFDAHTMNPVSVIQMVTALGGQCPRMIVVGCEPSTLDAADDGQFGLSEPLRAAVDEAIRLIQETVQGFTRAAAA